MSTTNVSYNRNRRKWQLTGEIGEILGEWPAGPQGHADAILAQIAYEDPAALDIALNLEETIPQLKGRAIRAAQILINNAIGPNRNGPRYYASSQHALTTDTYYTITHCSQDAPWSWHCSCADWSHGLAGDRNGAPLLLSDGRPGPICKHILAVLIGNVLQASNAARAWDETAPSCATGNGANGLTVGMLVWQIKADRAQAQLDALASTNETQEIPETVPWDA